MGGQANIFEVVQVMRLLSDLTIGFGSRISFQKAYLLERRTTDNIKALLHSHETLQAVKQGEERWTCGEGWGLLEDKTG